MDSIALRPSDDVGFGVHGYAACGCPRPLLAQINPCFQLHGASLHCDLSCPSGNACCTLRPKCCWRSYRLEESSSFRRDGFRDCSASCDDHMDRRMLSGLVRMSMTRSHLTSA